MTKVFRHLIFSSLNLIFNDGIFRHQMYFFSNFNRLGDKVLRHRLLLLLSVFFFSFFNFNRLGDKLFRHQFLFIVRYGEENYSHQFYFFINILYIYLPLH